jgi:prepilin-type N-terminal cleavage/methylation domain-containing protein
MQLQAGNKMKKSISEKYTILKNSKGFSVVELLLALALLLIALGLGYNLLFFARRSFERSEERWMEQNEVVAITNIIYDALNEAYYVAVVADKSDIDSLGLEFYGAFYIDGTGATIYQSFDNSLVSTTVLPGDQLTLAFAKETYVIGTTEYEYNDLLNMTVISNDLAYTLSTQVHLDNMNRERSLHGIASGPVVVFQTKDIVETIPEDIYGELCFIATASYGSPMDPSVRLLRRFRDEYLLESNWGTKFVEFYYKNSPPVASVIEGNSALRFITRAALYPIVGFVSLIMNPIHLLCVMAGILIAMILYKKRFKFVKQRQLK